MILPADPLRFAVEARRGPFHTVCVPGLVPDGPECFARQLPLLRRHGSLSVATYPTDDFPLDAVLDQLDRRVRELAAGGQPPLLFGVSVGGGLCLELLRRARAANAPLPVAGVILVSPLTCVDDLAPLLKRLLGPIVGALDRGDDPAAHVERGRAFFKGLASRALAGSDAPRPAWQTFLQLFTPAGIALLRDRQLRSRITRTLDRLPAHGAVARVACLRRLPGLDAADPAPLCAAPSQILWGAKERHTLDMDGPGTARLCRPDLAVRWFPDLEVQWVYGPDGDEAPHASLLRHAGAFNQHLRRFLARLARRHAAARPTFLPNLLRWAR
jgi:acetyl esterase/lipase